MASPMLRLARWRGGVAVHVLLWLLGAVHWLVVLNWGDIPMSLLDWG